MSRSLSVALVGPHRQENLALQYLAAGAQRAGHRTRLVGYNGREDLVSAVHEVIDLAPDLVGLAIPFQYCIDDALLFARALREEGFAGHLTCGGHVPTFCWRELLRDCPAIDSVVRHEGEETFLDLLRVLAAGLPAAELPGLAWRAKDGLLAGPRRPQIKELDSLPLPLRGGEPYCVGGVPMGFVIGARGCIGECEYCSIAAFESGARGGRYRLRKPEPIADEIAELVRTQGARIIFFHDDLFIMPSERATVARLHALREGLARRGIGDTMFWVKGRPENITPAVLDAAREMGVDHIFLGVENASLERLRYLGRIHTPEDNRRALALCRAHGILPSFNFMLFDPDCTLEDVAVTLDFAADHVGMPWNVCRTEIYSGTALRDRLEQEGRLQGDYRSYGYVMRDVRAEIMFRLLRVALHERAFAFDSLLNRLISLSFARQVHERFFPGETTQKFSARVIALIDLVQRDTLDVLRRALDHVASADLQDARTLRRHAVDLGLRANTRALAWHHEAETLWDVLNARGLRRTGVQGRTLRGAIGS